MGLQNNKAAEKGGLPDLPEHKQKAMIESYANFYGVEDDPKVSKLSYNKLYQARYVSFGDIRRRHRLRLQCCHNLSLSQNNN